MNFLLYGWENSYISDKNDSKATTSIIFSLFFMTSRRFEHSNHMHSLKKSYVNNVIRSIKIRYLLQIRSELSPFRYPPYSSKCSFEQMFIWVNVHSSKCLFEQMFIRANVHSSKCSFEQMFIREKDFRANVRSSKCPFEQMSVWANVHSSKCPFEHLP